MSSTISSPHSADVLTVQKPRWKRRLAVRLLVCSAILAGLCWTAFRLNATERKLVGVWTQGESNVTMLLADRRVMSAYKRNGKWESHKFEDLYWRATSKLLTLRDMSSRPNTASPVEWIEYLNALRQGEYRLRGQIVRLTDDQLEVRGEDGNTNIVNRSPDSELLRLFEQLSAGGSE